MNKESGETIDVSGWKKIYKSFLFLKEDIEAIETAIQPNQMAQTQRHEIMKGTATSINSAFAEGILGDHMSIEFWMGFELKISDYITSMNNNNPATVPKPNNPLYIIPPPKDCTISIGFSKMNLDKLVRMKILEQE